MVETKPKSEVQSKQVNSEEISDNTSKESTSKENTSKENTSKENNKKENNKKEDTTSKENNKNMVEKKGFGLLWRALFGLIVAFVVTSYRQGKLDSYIKDKFVDFGIGNKNNNNDNQNEQASEQVNNAVSDEQFSATFVNNYPKSVSLYWESEDDMHLVVNSIPSGQSVPINTFNGHRFLFTREGTRDVIGTSVQVSPNDPTYILDSSAKLRSEVEGPCFDRMPQRCRKMAEDGECDRNPGWMIVNCPRSCDSCDLLDKNKRCSRKFLNITEENIWQPGDLNKMFERIVADYGATVVSSPAQDGPWVLQFDDFLNDEEIKTLLKWGHKTGFERSTDVGEENAFGETTKVVSQHRTSANAWCMFDCEKDPIVMGITKRTEEVTKVPSAHYESFQLLEYDLNQYYRGHHDMSPKAKYEAAGPRILTFFLYLSDVEEGGETEFPRINIKVKPKRGRAILWPSVLDSDPWAQDPRTFHAALPVIKGKKYAANHWIHSNNFKQANHWGCSGSFS